MSRILQMIQTAERSGVWAIQAERLEDLAANLRAGKANVAEVEARYQDHMAGGSDEPYTIDSQGRAWVAMCGPLFADGPDMEIVAWWCGGLTYGQLVAAVEAAALDPLAREVWLSIDSPGGMVTGVAEAALALDQAGAVKPLYAYVVGCMASAAYWTGSRARRIYASPTAHLGSIGVVCTVYDDAGYLRLWGIDRYVVTDDGAPRKRPDYSAADGLDDLKRNANAVAVQFRAAVAQARGVDEAWVLEQMGRGAVLVADPDALAARLCDAIALDLDATLALETAGPGPEPEDDDEGEDAPPADPPAEGSAAIKEIAVDIKAAVAAATLQLQQKLEATTKERDLAVAERDTLREAVAAYKEREAAAEAERAKLEAAAFNAQVEAMFQRHTLRGLSFTAEQRAGHTARAEKFGVQAVDELLASIPPGVPTELIGGGSGAGAASAKSLHEQIEARAKKDGVSYDVAYDALYAEQPDAFKAAATDAAHKQKKEPRR